MDLERGEQGEQGEQGVQGHQGIQGPRGFRGANDHDLLIEMATDMRHMRAHFDEIASTVSRLDRDAVTHSALRRAMGTVTGLVLAVAAGLGVWLHDK